MEKQYLTKSGSRNYHHLIASPAAPIQQQSFSIQEVLIFKTGIKSQADQLQIKATLDRHPLILQWNIDLEDIDCVLRVISKYLAHSDIIELITQQGYHCEELA